MGAFRLRSPICALRSISCGRWTSIGSSTVLDYRCDDHGAFGGNGIQPFSGCEYRRRESKNKNARSSCRGAYSVVCGCIRSSVLPDICVRGVAAQSPHVFPVSNRAVDHSALFVHKAIYPLVSHRVGVRSRNRSCRSMDCDQRFVGPKNSVVDRGRHFLGRRV